MYLKRFLTGLIFFITFVCMGDAITVEKLQKVAEERIYFAHQSVGFNILNGISLISSDLQVPLNIVETSDVSKLHGAFFAQSRIGENTRPESKIEDFYNKMHNGLGESVDIAFLKLCFVDINPETDINSLLKEYQTVFNKLRLQFPGTVFVHFTVPLTAKETGLRGAKAVVKRILGRSVKGYQDDLRRQQYNELLRKAYKGKEPLFDLAEIESTRPDGTRESARLKGELYYRLVPEYTTDGGHLNEEGQRIVAEKLLVFLANLE